MKGKGSILKAAATPRSLRDSLGSLRAPDVRRIATIVGLTLSVLALPAFGQRGATSCVHSPSADATVFDLTNVTEQPVLNHMEPPRLPPEFYRLPVNVQVMLSFIVNKNGTVDSGSVVVAEPQGSKLEAEAVRAVRRDTFSPGCRDGEAVRVRVQFPIRFVSPAH